MKAASIENNITEQTSTTNKNIPNLDSVISSEIHNKEDIDVLKVKYTSFVDEYYQKAIEKDKELIQKLKGV